MNKKAQESMLFDIYPALIFCVIGVIVWLLIARLDSIQSNNVIQDEKKNIGNDEFLLSLLKIRVDETNLGDSLDFAIINNDKATFQKNMDGVLKETYGGSVCWKLFVDGNSFINNPCATDSKEDLVDSRIIFPSAYDNQMRNVTFVITGLMK